jgi:hypothetical protein
VSEEDGAGTARDQRCRVGGSAGSSMGASAHAPLCGVLESETRQAASCDLDLECHRRRDGTRPESRSAQACLWCDLPAPVPAKSCVSD